MKRPSSLTEIPMAVARSGGVNILIGPGEWDGWIQEAYDGGHSIIEYDKEERPARAFQKKKVDLQMSLFKDGRGGRG